MSNIKMVELKAKVCVATLCACESRLPNPHHHHHHTTTIAPTPHHHHHHTTTTATTTTTVLPQRTRHQHPLSQPHHTPAPPRVKMPPGPFATRIVRKYRRSRLKRVKRQEYKKLRDMVPALQEKPRVSKVEVIDEAIKYIDELHTALIERFRTRGLPATLKELPAGSTEVHGGNIRDLVRHLLASSNPASLPPARIENARTTPSFMTKLAKARRL